MIKKIIILFKIARRISQSNIINIVSEFHKVPKVIKFFSYILSFSFSKSDDLKINNINDFLSNFDAESITRKRDSKNQIEKDLVAIRNLYALEKKELDVGWQQKR